MTRKDTVSKTLLKPFAYELARLLLDLPLKADSIEFLETEQQRVEIRRADLVIGCEDLQGEHFILHIEIQNSNDPEMLNRMLRYFSDIRFAHPDLPIRQFVIYTGRDTCRLRTQLQTPEVDYRYRLLNMHEVDCRQLLSLDNPEAIVLSVLCDFKGQDNVLILLEILQRLQAITTSGEQYTRYLDMLEILVENRILEPELKKAEAMLTEVDRTRLPSYQIGLSDGEARGRIEGEARGRMEGEARGRMEGKAEQARKIAVQLMDIIHDDQVLADKTGLELSEVQRLRTQHTLV